MSEPGLVDITGRLRSPAATPGHWAGCAPPNKGLRYPADPPTVEEIILVMREAGPGPYADRTRGLIAILWRAGLADQRSARAHRDRSGPEDRLGAGPRRARAASAGWSGWTTGLGARRPLDRAPDPAARSARCSASSPDRPAAAAGQRQLPAASFAGSRPQAGVRRRFAPHQLRHAHAIEMAHEGIPLPIIQRQLGHAHLGITSI